VRNTVPCKVVVVTSARDIGLGGEGTLYLAK
jgi:hypothetical protein